MDVFRKLWWGLYPLSQSFWGFYIFGGVGIVLLSSFLGALFLMKFPQLRSIVYSLGICVVWTYGAIATVGVWRSASLYKGDVRARPIAAKCVVAYLAGILIFRALALVGRTMGIWNWSL